MKKHIDTEELLGLLEQLESDLDKDIASDNFVEGSEVTWLSSSPKSDEEKVKNLLDRLKTIGVRLTASSEKVIQKAKAHPKCSMAEIAEICGWEADFDAAKIDRQSIGEAAFVRSDYRKSS